MKHYEKLIELGCFSRSDIANYLGNDATAASLLRDYQKKGYIERVRPDLYTVISLETHQPVRTRYQIGAQLFSDAVISHHSSFEVFGYANQVFNEVYVATNSRFPDFEYNGVLYHRVLLRPGTHMDAGHRFRLTSLEQTLIDSIADFEKIAGLEETLRCMMLIPALDEQAMVEILTHRQNGFLWQKCGYILSQFSNELRLTREFFETCKAHIPGGKRALQKESTTPLVWEKEWKLFAPRNLRSMLEKGVNESDGL